MQLLALPVELLTPVLAELAALDIAAIGVALSGHIPPDILLQSWRHLARSRCEMEIDPGVAVNECAKYFVARQLRDTTWRGKAVLVPGRGQLYQASELSKWAPLQTAFRELPLPQPFRIGMDTLEEPARRTYVAVNITKWLASNVAWSNAPLLKPLETCGPSPSQSAVVSIAHERLRADGKVDVGVHLHVEFLQSLLNLLLKNM